jgi:serine/threonine protein kinase
MLPTLFTDAPSAPPATLSVLRSVRREEAVDDWVIDFKDIELFDRIGEGSSGKVYVAWWMHTPVAIKFVEGSPRLEANLMLRMRHPNVASLFGMVVAPTALVMEYCSQGTLDTVLARGGHIEYNDRVRMAMDVARGMNYLHTRTPAILHRDLKSPNVLVHKSGEAKVADFNTSAVCSGPAPSRPPPDNPMWLAPEVLAGQECTKASDVYSFGIIMWEVFTRQKPWSSMTGWDQVRRTHLNKPGNREHI